MYSNVSIDGGQRLSNFNSSVESPWERLSNLFSQVLSRIIEPIILCFVYFLTPFNIKLYSVMCNCVWLDQRQLLWPGIHRDNLVAAFSPVYSPRVYMKDTKSDFFIYWRCYADNELNTNTTERSLLETIDSCTLLLLSCVMSSYFKSTISDCNDASILYSLWNWSTYWFLDLSIWFGKMKKELLG